MSPDLALKAKQGFSQEQIRIKFETTQLPHSHHSMRNHGLQWVLQGKTLPDQDPVASKWEE